MRDPNTGLTNAALVGVRKQSVPDAERLLSYQVAQFMTNHGHQLEGDYVYTIAAWHDANDGRGLSQLRRSKKNYLMLNYLLDEFMPWHSEQYDFRLLDINRYFNNYYFQIKTLLITASAKCIQRNESSLAVTHPVHPFTRLCIEMFHCGIKIKKNLMNNKYVINN